MKRIILMTLAVIAAQLLISCGHNKKNSDQNNFQADKNQNAGAKELIYKSENLIINRISEHVYQHTSFLETRSNGQIPSNGIIVINADDAIVIDTPTSDQTSIELLDFLTVKMNATISAVVATHFHLECLGGLQAFHRFGISSYASNKTIKLAVQNKSNIPQQGFDKELILTAGGKKIYLEHLGEGHTIGNIVCYFPEDKVLFGGSLIKEIGAGKGDLDDANTTAWPQTVSDIVLKFPELTTVVPGQGKAGGPELLEYTKRLFQ